MNVLVTYTEYFSPKVCPYVREILASLTVGEVTSVSDTSTKFHLPEDHQQTFVALSVLSRFMPLFGMRYNNIKACAQQRNPGGKITCQNNFIYFIYMMYSNQKIFPDVNLTLTLYCVSITESGISVAEFGCATGVLVNKLASRFKNSTFLGSDITGKPLEIARADANSRGIQNISYSTDNIENLPEKYNDSFDWILTRFVIHDLAYPRQALNQIYQCLKPGGIFSMIEVGLEGGIAGNIANGTSMFYYSASTFMCIPESFRQPDSAALGATWGASLAREMVVKAGFTIINETASHTDEKEIHFVCQK
ncbi:S-adenosylmethionine-dependent methyltransferase Rv2258c-like [Haliotis asinina]|uniref:S-adenosylmethionine-dependent methyltransferase Rv2258c-like n=1 Tax=Haliotis asinina TaxID=109174 RepID=UPI0035318B69